MTKKIILLICIGILWSSSSCSNTNNTDISEKEIGPKDKLEEEKQQHEYVLPESDSKMILESDIQNLSESELRLAINEIYARHGRIFTNENSKIYFNSLSWYEERIDGDKFDESVFNEFEKINLELLIQFEKNKQIQEIEAEKLVEIKKKYFSGVDSLFLTSIYDKPENIDLNQLFYMGTQVESYSIPNEELQELSKIRGDVVYNFDIIKVTYEEMNDFFYKKTGVELNNDLILDGYTYIEKYNSYYKTISDTNLPIFEFTRGIREGDTIKLYYLYSGMDNDNNFLYEVPCIVTIIKNNDTYFIYSNLLE